jgi:hypothetical protein
VSAGRWRAWRNGRAVIIEEIRIGIFETEALAVSEAERRGGVLCAQRMAGALYSLPDGRGLRVSRLGWAPGFALLEYLIRCQRCHRVFFVGMGFHLFGGTPQPPTAQHAAAATATRTLHAMRVRACRAW